MKFFYFFIILILLIVSSCTVIKRDGYKIKDEFKELIPKVEKYSKYGNPKNYKVVLHSTFDTGKEARSYERNYVNRYCASSSLWSNRRSGKKSLILNKINGRRMHV